MPSVEHDTLMILLNEQNHRKSNNICLKSSYSKSIFVQSSVVNKACITYNELKTFIKFAEK